MKITITPKAQEFIRKKGNSITLSIEKKETGCSCCGDSTVELTSIKLGVPQGALNEYQICNVMGIDLYLHTSIQAEIDTAISQLDVEGTLFGKKLVLYGLKQQ